jgi:transcriptional regulator with XRE-family HTH domain
MNIDWSSVIQALVALGVTQSDIAKACACGQSTISELRSGRTTDPRVSTASALMRLAFARGIRIPCGVCGAPLNGTQPSTADRGLMSERIGRTLPPGQ